MAGLKELVEYSVIGLWIGLSLLAISVDEPIREPRRRPVAV